MREGNEVDCVRVGLATPVPVLLVGVLALWPGPVEAQCRPPRGGRPLTAAGDRMLDFGNVFPGVQATVPRSDPVRAGQFSLTGTNCAEMRIDFTLPASLSAPSGQTLTLVWTAGDGAFSTSNTVSAATAFDPRVPLVTRLSQQGKLYIWLGATALPSPTQGAASYSGTITLTSAYTGN